MSARSKLSQKQAGIVAASQSTKAVDGRLRDARDIRNGGLFDRSLLNTKLALATLTGNEMLNRSVYANATLVLNSLTAYEVMARTLQGNNVIIGGITSDEVGDRSLFGTDLVLATVTGNEVANRSLYNSDLVLHTLTDYEMAQTSLTDASMAARGINAHWALQVATVTGQEVAGATLQGGNIVARSVYGNSSLVLGSVTSNEVAGRSLSGDDLALQTITLDVIWNGIKDPAFATFGLRSLSGTGTLFAAASADHTHSSTPFVHYEREERLAMLDERRKLQKHAGSMHEVVKDPGKLAEVLELLTRNTLTSLHLQFDYKEMVRDKIEEKLDQGGAWADEYRERNLMHMTTRHHPLPARPVHAASSEASGTGEREGSRVRENWKTHYQAMKTNMRKAA